MDIKLILLLKKTARERLAWLKTLAAQHPYYGGMHRLYRSGVRPLTMHHYAINANDPERAKRFFQSEQDIGLRRVGWSDEHLHIRHTGWYSDNYQEETFRGVVFRLTARPGGRERFVAGYFESMSEGFVLDLSEIWEDDLTGAAQEGDRLAERAAEEARDFEAKDAAALRIEEIGEELKGIRSEILELCQSIRKACPEIGQHKPIRSALRRALQGLLRDRNSLISERQDLEDDYWVAVPDR